MKPVETILYTPYYKAESERRQGEIDYCLLKNMECEAIDRIVLLVDDGSEPSIESNKVSIVSLHERPTYRDWIEVAARRSEHYSILANSDIYFDDSLPSLAPYLDRSFSLVALSRWDQVGDALVPHPNPQWSQDVWAIKSSGRIHQGLLERIGMQLGVPRCDNKLAYLFSTHGYEIHNPCRKVTSVHVHQSEERAYDKRGDTRILGGVAYVYPSTEPSAPSKLDFDIWSLSASTVQTVSVNRSFLSWHGEDGIQGLVSRDVAPIVSVRDAVARRSTEMDEGCEGLVYSFLDRFQIWRRDAGIEIVDNLWKTREAIDDLSDTLFTAPGVLREDILYRFFPKWDDVPQFSPGDRPSSGHSAYFWQYPCLTEKQAYQNAKQADGRAVAFDGKGGVCVYLPVPWATLIDRKTDIPRILRVMTFGVAGLKALVNQHGYALEVHTVCQHIHWRRIVKTIRNVGVTHLHVSHLEEGDSGEYVDLGLVLLPWQLYAVNAEDPERSPGLDFGRKPAERKHLASFIGAYRRNYRSDARLALRAEMEADQGDDLLVEINDEWHFERVVYGEQVSSRSIATDDRVLQEERTYRYNSVLSDSVFSLCPDGTGPNTLRLWESLAVGSIPVVVSDGWIPPEIPGSEIQLRDVCVFLGRKDIRGVFSRLRGMSSGEVSNRHANARMLYKKLSKMSPITRQISGEGSGDNRSSGSSFPEIRRSIREFQPSYVWPNEAFPFREYYASEFGRIFIIENIIHNFEWLKTYRRYIRPTDIFIVLVGWYHDRALVEESCLALEHLGLPIESFIVLYNSEDDRSQFEPYGFLGRVIPQNAWLDENRVFRPLDIRKAYDAIYVGRRSAMKRHWLAKQVRSLAIVAGRNHGNDIAPVPPRLYMNDRPLEPDEVCRKINQSRCGLILSKREGACFASSEYLLCGVPVVSTESKGGRDVWYNSYNSIVCRADPRAVADAVAEFVTNPRDPCVIRTTHINQAKVYRHEFIQLLSETLKQFGDAETSPGVHFERNFMHKMRKSVKPDFERIFRAKEKVV